MKRNFFTSPPKTGGGQSGRARISVLLALLALCLSLPFMTGCPESNSGDASSNLRKRAERAAKVVEHAASDIETVADVARELRAAGVIDEEGARVIASAALEANAVLSEAVEGALSYASLDEFSRAGLATHLGRFRSALSNLNDSGALHVKNPKRRAALSAFLVASGAVISRLESDLDEPLPAGVSTPLDDAIRRRLERARAALARADKKLREDLARPQQPSA